MHLLIVDDDRATVDGLAELLEHAGFDCDGATSFEAAIVAMRTSPPDVLVTDIRLQAFNGLHLVRRRPVGTYAIVMSAFPDPVLHTEAHRLGAPFLGKPVQTRQLLELLKRVHAHPRDLLD
jgi:DNA-binding response OmpR family regulator